LKRSSSEATVFARSRRSASSAAALLGLLRPLQLLLALGDLRLHRFQFLQVGGQR
jgi:hypothetical protein